MIVFNENRNIAFDNEKLLQALDKSDKRHECYTETVEIASGMGVHFYGDMPAKLLKEYRPNEQQEIYDYRISIWKPITKSLADKVINTVNKILNPKYFYVKFPEESPFNLYDDDEQLPVYLTRHYPIYGTIWHWLKETFLRKDFADPNSLIAILPYDFEPEDNEAFEPVPVIYDSSQMVHYDIGEYYLLYEVTGKNSEGIIRYFDRDVIRKYYRKGSDINLIAEYEHEFGEVPAFFSGGYVNETESKYYYESFVGGVQPHWDKVVEMSSDKDGCIVNHLYPERYEYQVPCTNNGCRSGYVELHPEELGFSVPKGTRTKPQRIKCPKCGGTGMITNRSPFGAYTVSLDALNPDAPIPDPPVNYIQKDIAPLNALTEEIEKQKQAGFNAINFEILNQVGENQSGIAKVMDRQDMDAFLMRISSHVFDYILPNVVKFTAYWIYNTQYDISVINEYLDEIQYSKPKEFNVLTVDNLMEEYTAAKTSGANGNYLKKIESEIVSIKYAHDEAERLKNLAIVTLQPFPDKSIDDLMTARGIRAIREKDLILNNNIDLLIDIAIDEDEEFLTKSKIDQLNALYAIIERDFIEAAPEPTIPVNPDPNLDE